MISGKKAVTNTYKLPILQRLCNIHKSPILLRLCNIHKLSTLQRLCNIHKSPTSQRLSNINKPLIPRLLLISFAITVSLLIGGCSWFPFSLSENTPSPTAEVPVYGQEEIEDEREAFDTFINECFIQIVTSDTLKLHQVLEYPENYGITDPEITFGSFSKNRSSKTNSSSDADSSNSDSSSGTNSSGTSSSTGTNSSGTGSSSDTDSSNPDSSSGANSSNADSSPTSSSLTSGIASENLGRVVDIADATDEEILEMLRSFRRDCLTESQQLAYDVFEDALELFILEDEYRLFAEPLSTISGEHTMLPVILSEYRFQRLEDVYTYLALLETLPDYITSMLDFEKEKSEAGLFMPDSAADDVINTCRSFTEDSEDHILIASFDNRLEEFDTLSEEEKRIFSGMNARLVREIFIPEFERLAQGIEALKGTGRKEIGLCSFEGGKEYVEYLCRSLTGTEYTPGQIIDILTDEVTQSTAELYRIISQKPDLIAELDNFDFGVTQPEEIFEELQEKSKVEFPTPAATNYTVSYVPDFLEPYTAQAFYLLPPIDTEIVNRIYINASQTNDPIELFTVMAHEGYPGHMLQQLYFLEKNAPPLRRVFTYLGYLEGWAQYISYRSFEFNENASAELIRAMQLNELINYDVSALCDLYVNYSGFTQKQLEKYLSDNGFSSAVADELYASFINNPGVYLPYAVGSFEVRSLKAFAEESLGEAFNAYDFHKALLDVGQAPFSVIRREIEKWVDSVKVPVLSSRLSAR